MALAGPATSLAVAGACFALTAPCGSVGSFDARFGLFLVGQLNLMLGVFNLLPGLPDGRGKDPAGSARSRRGRGPGHPHRGDGREGVRGLFALAASSRGNVLSRRHRLLRVHRRGGRAARAAARAPGPEAVLLVQAFAWSRHGEDEEAVMKRFVLAELLAIAPTVSWAARGRTFLSSTTTAPRRSRLTRRAPSGLPPPVSKSGYGIPHHGTWIKLDRTGNGRRCPR